MTHPLTPGQVQQVQRLALDFEARKLFQTPAECKAAAEQQIRDELSKAERRKAATAEPSRSLFGV